MPLPMCAAVHSRIQLAKQRMYGDVDWCAAGYGTTPRPEAASAASSAPGIPTFHCSDLSPDRFQKEYAEQGQVVLITGLLEQWPAMHTWTTASLYQNGEHRHTSVPIGQDDAGDDVEITLEDFLSYMVAQTDDAPLYLFSSTELIDDEQYWIPPGTLLIARDTSEPSLVAGYFSTDVLCLYDANAQGPPGLTGLPSDTGLDPKFGPPYRWILIGPRGSGSTVHQVHPPPVPGCGHVGLAPRPCCCPS